MGVISYIFINLLIFLTHLLLAHKWLRPKGRSITEVVIAGVLSASAQMIVTMVALGMFFELLQARAIFLTNAAMCVFLLTMARSLPRDVKILVADIGGWIVTGWRTVKGDAVLSVLAFLLALLFLWLLFLGVVLPPYSWDGLVYHLGTVGYWMQDGRIGDHAVFDGNFINCYPLNIELLFFWNTVFLRNDLLVNCFSFL